MSKKLQIILLFFLIASLIFTSFYIRDFRIDASSDSLVSQNDEDYKYFSYYQDLFPTKNSLVIAIKSNSKIDGLMDLCCETDNTFPVVDSETGELIGEIDRTIIMKSMTSG